MRAIRRVVLVTAVVLLTTPAGSTEPSTRVIYLRGGAEIRGEILNQRPDRVVVDLGYTVLTVPTDEIERIEDVITDRPETTTATQVVDVFRASPQQPELSVKENLGRCGEAVVEIRTSTSLGSGFIISPEGHVVTNDHVISGESKVSVTLFRQPDDGLEKVPLHDVEILATDPTADLALLKIRGLSAPLPFVPLGDSGAVRQGQVVFAVGSPLGLERSVSEGIVSLRNRLIGGRLLLQSTTQLNPGNSGGPLLNLRGEVVGVNNLKILAAGIEGLNFSIPVDTLKQFLLNRDAFAFDPRNPNAGFRYNEPPRPAETPTGQTDGD